MKRTVIFIIAIALSLQFLYADQCISDGFSWSERVVNNNYCSAIFTCKVLDNIAIKKEHKNEFGEIIYTENEFRIVVKVEKNFFGKIDTDTVNINNGVAMEPGKTYLIYANHDNQQENYFHLAGRDYCRDENHSKKVTTEKNVIRELEILSELSNIINNKLTCKYVMLDAENNKLAEGFFKNGERVKIWKHYWPNAGNIKAEYDFTNNSVIQYKIIDYYHTGKLKKLYATKSLGNDRDGFVEMDFKIYYATGKIKAKGEFLNNDSVGTWYFYDGKGKLDFQLAPISETRFYGKIITENGDAYYGGIFLTQNKKEIARYLGFGGTFYIKDSIPPGVYDARVCMEGYKTELIKNIKIIPGSTIVLNVQLKGGSERIELISYVPKEDLEIPEHIS